MSFAKKILGGLGIAFLLSGAVLLGVGFLNRGPSEVVDKSVNESLTEQNESSLPFQQVVESDRYFEEFNDEYSGRGFLLFGNFDSGMSNETVAEQCYWMASSYAFAPVEILIVESTLGSKITSGPESHSPGKLCYISDVAISD